MIEPTGRELGGGELSIRSSVDGIRVRVDDDYNHAFWFELFIPADDLLALANVVATLRDQPHLGEGRIRQSWGRRL